jgi:pilus assembly protein CpaB
MPVVAVAMALVTTLAVIGYLQRVRQEAAVVAPVKTEAVVFAKTNIGERKVLTADALELRQLPASAIHPQAARRLQDAANRVTVAPIFADEQVLLNKLAPAGVIVGLSYVLPKTKRAMTLAVNEVIGVAGFVFPGDRVDVVGTVTEGDTSFTKIVLQDVEVVAIAQKVEQKPGEEAKVTTSATLVLTPDQVETLAQIDNSGKVRLALRPYGVSEQVRTSGKSVAAVLGRSPQAAPVLQAAVANTVASLRPAYRPRALRPASTPPAPPARVYSVDVWRATTKTTTAVTEGRR